MSCLNKAMLIGNLGKDPEARDVGTSKVCSFSLATNEVYKDKEGKKQTKTEWHNIVVWGALSENCVKYLRKGSQAYIEGKIQTRKWTDKNGVDRFTTEVVALTVQFLNTNASSHESAPPPSEPPNGTPVSGQPQQTQTTQQPQYSEDDIPF